MFLTQKEIRKKIEREDLVKNFIDLKRQLTPHGFDLTAGKIFKFLERGRIDFSNSQRLIPQAEEILPVREKEADKFGWWILQRGAYKVRTNEILNIPKNILGIAFPRSSLLRMGVFIQNAIWDAGFSGKGEFILVVENPYGVCIKENARLVQIIFCKVKKSKEYQGIFKGLI